MRENPTMTSLRELYYLLCVLITCGLSVQEVTLALSCDSPSSFRCGEDTQCVNVTDKCTGVSECRNGHDESVAVCGCPSWEFQCNSTHCIDMIKHCDRHEDCDNGWDETGCETHLCPPTHMRCDNHFCIPRELKCDFKDDCGDNSDEKEEICAFHGCYSSDWECDNRQCVYNAFLCDGHEDCYDGSDEMYCDNHTMCANELYVSRDHRCDGWVDCIGSQDDEIGCACDATLDYVCPDGRCIHAANVCDGVCDCGVSCQDEVCDEVPCLSPGRFICQRTSRCIRAEFVCDGRNDCRNNDVGHDEEYCLLPGEDCPPSVQCSDGKCLLFGPHSVNISCNHVPDCTDREDERNCDFPECPADRPYRCDNHQCIRYDQLCDTMYDCYDHSDETNCGGHSCPENYTKCAISGQCIPSSSVCDYRKDCMDGSDERHCDKLTCEDDEFTCTNGQCIPIEYVCIYDRYAGDVTSCADESHLLKCKEFTCPAGYVKCRNSYCIRENYVCDQVVDCRATYTDEDTCQYSRPCPYRPGEENLPDFLLYPDDIPQCTCYNQEMDCEGLGLTEIPDMTHESKTQLRFSGNYLNDSLSPDVFQFYSHFTYLDISDNCITELGVGYFMALWRLSALNLANNNLTRITNGTFYGLGSLQTLYLDGNQIEYIEAYSFLGLSSLTVLDLSDQKVHALTKNAFSGLRSLRNLDLSSNLIEMVEDGSFNGLTSLMMLDISDNKIRIIGDNVFYGMPSLDTLRTDEFRFCCLAASVTQCWPKPNEFSSCEDLMSNAVLRVCIWVLGLLSLFGNTLVIYWRLRDTRDSKVHSFLITNLAIGDLLMGVYLLIIAAVDLKYRGIYIVYDVFWRQSGLCTFAGFLSTYSSELSVLTLTVITVDRFISIIFPFRIKRMNMRHARTVMVILWAVVFAIAALPLLKIPYFENFYGRSGVCLALHITPEKPSGWQYSVFVFLALNFVSFLLIFLSYMWMFVVARRTRAAVRSPQMRTDHAMARRMTLIVLTDFSCWVPIICLGVASLCGASIHPQVFAWIAVFVLPLNSAINPILYTISTASFLGHARTRAFKFRKSFLSSLATTDNTKVTGISGAGDRGSPGRDWTRTSNRQQKRHPPKECIVMYSANNAKDAKHNNTGVNRKERQKMLRLDSGTSTEYTRTDGFNGYDSDQ